jgi:hypothetical protein
VSRSTTIRSWTTRRAFLLSFLAPLRDDNPGDDDYQQQQEQQNNHYYYDDDPYGKA